MPPSPYGRGVLLAPPPSPYGRYVLLMHMQTNLFELGDDTIGIFPSIAAAAAAMLRYAICYMLCYAKASSRAASSSSTRAGPSPEPNHALCRIDASRV